MKIIITLFLCAALLLNLSCSNPLQKNKACLITGAPRYFGTAQIFSSQCGVFATSVYLKQTPHT